MNVSYQIWLWACDELIVFSRRKEKVSQRPFETTTRIGRKESSDFRGHTLLHNSPTCKDILG